MPEPKQAVFLSCASQDAEPAARTACTGAYYVGGVRYRCCGLFGTS
jgi:hypothetical protein